MNLPPTFLPIPPLQSLQSPGEFPESYSKFPLANFNMIQNIKLITYQVFLDIIILNFDINGRLEKNHGNKKKKNDGNVFCIENSLWA